MILPGRATGKREFQSGERAARGGRRLLGEIGERLRDRHCCGARTSPRSSGTLASTACTSTTAVALDHAEPQTVIRFKTDDLHESNPCLAMTRTPGRRRGRVPARLSAGNRFREVTWPVDRRRRKAWIEKYLRASVHTASGRQPAPRASATSDSIAIFVGVLGVDGLAGAELERFAGHLHLLPFEAGEMHFDAVALAVVEGVMLECVELERCRRARD